MPTTIPLIHEFKKSTTLVRFQVGDNLPIYVNRGSDEVWFADKQDRKNSAAHLYLPEPRIGIELPKQTGTLDEEACSITIPRYNSQHAGLATFSQMLSGPRRIPPVEVWVYNLIQSSPTETTVVYLYNGVLDKDARNPDGKQGVIRLDFQPDYVIYMEDSTLGRRMDATCDLIFGKNGCGVDTTGIFDPSTYWTAAGPAGAHWEKIRKAFCVCTVDPQSTGRKVSLTLNQARHPGADDRTITDQSELWWKDGFLEKDGLRIRISQWLFDTNAQQGTNEFILSGLPPESWNNSEVVLNPGCQKTPASCQKRGNLSNFGGLGYGIPAYNPVLETQ